MARKRNNVDPWDNLQMSWDTPPDRVRLKTDAAAMNVSWPFGDDVAEVFESLDDRYFKVFLKKAWKLCQQEARRRPEGERAAFLAEQKRRLERYGRKRAVEKQRAR